MNTAALWRIAPVLTHLERMTSQFGIVQHATGDQPNLAFGYSIDDNARALLACLWLQPLFPELKLDQLADTYLRNIIDSQLPDGRFHNFRASNGQFSDQVGSDDSNGRALWALGVVRTHWPERWKLTAPAFAKAKLHVLHFNNPRTLAFSLLGLLTAGDSLVRTIRDKLLDMYAHAAQPNWPWFESSALTYSNAILPYSLLCDTTTDPGRALESLNFLNRVCRRNGTPAPIGNNGWFAPDGTPALFDQQCVDAADMVLANIQAFRRTGNPEYWQQAVDWFNWFYGNNVHNQVMVTKNGGVYDGLTPKGINLNQGAESVVTYLLTHAAMYECEQRYFSVAEATSSE